MIARRATVVVSVIWRCEVASIVDFAMSDAATAARKVASSDSRIFGVGE